MSRIFRILSIDGGGFRGLYSARILQRIEEEFDLELGSVFDLIAGTSTGSIIAAGIAARIPAGKICALYQAHGPGIFRKRLFSRFGLLSSRYRPDRLRSALSALLGDRRLGDIDIPLIIPATDISNGTVHVFKSQYDVEFVRDRNVLLRDAVLASCAAPTYFDPHRVGDCLLADGGLWANSPLLVAIIDARRRLNADLENVRVLSIGTGTSHQFYSQASRWWKSLCGWGLFTCWGRTRLVDMFLNLQVETVDNIGSLLLRPEQITRLTFEADVKLALDDVREEPNLLARADRDFTHAADRIREFFKNGVPQC